MHEHHLTKIPVYAGNVDNIIGMVHLRQLFLKPDVPLDRLVQPVQFVPEQKTVESLLEFFRKTGTDMAVVVDEYGGHRRLGPAGGHRGGAVRQNRGPGPASSRSRNWGRSSTGWRATWPFTTGRTSSESIWRRPASPRLAGW